jgi:hypothetical protein
MVVHYPGIWYPGHKYRLVPHHPNPPSHSDNQFRWEVLPHDGAAGTSDRSKTALRSESTSVEVTTCLDIGYPPIGVISFIIPVPPESNAVVRYGWIRIIGVNNRSNDALLRLKGPGR